MIHPYAPYTEGGLINPESSDAYSTITANEAYNYFSPFPASQRNRQLFADLETEPMRGPARGRVTRSRRPPQVYNRNTEVSAHDIRWQVREITR